MASPFVCATCGQPVTLGRHKSGWRHTKEDRPDHRVVRITRDAYNSQIKAEGHQGSQVATSSEPEMDFDHEQQHAVNEMMRQRALRRSDPSDTK